MTRLMLSLLLAVFMAVSASAQQTETEITPGTQMQQTSRAQEQTGTTEPEADSLLAKVGEVLLVFLVLSTIFEVALTPIFNWRVFLARFEKKGIKTPLTVAIAFLVFWRYDLDILRDVLVALNYSASITLPGQAMTALLIAGGSDGVLRIFTKLGIRDPVDREKRATEAQAALEAKKSTPTPQPPAPPPVT